MHVTHQPVLFALETEWLARGWKLDDLGAFRMEDPPADPPKDPPADPPVVDYKAEAEKWKAHARKHETSSKALSKELETIKASQMSDSDKAIAEAEARGRQAATGEVAQKLVAARIEVALTGVVPDPASVVEDLNLAKYINDAGDVDVEAVAALKAKYAGFTKPGNGDPDPLRQGGQGNGKPAQLTRDQLKTMTSEQINKAREEGRCNDLLGIK